MYFVYVVVIAVAILAILTALAALFGGSKPNRIRSVWLLLAAIGEVLWGVATVSFLSLSANETSYAIAPGLIKVVYIGAIIMNAALLAYVSWRYRVGKIFSVVFAVVGLIFAILLFCDSSILYSQILLGGTSNSISIDISRGFYIAYLVYFCALNLALFSFIICTIRHTANKKLKQGLLFSLVGLLVTELFFGIFNLILPIFKFDLVWVGPLVVGLAILSFYFSIIKYKVVSLSSFWLKILSSAIITLTAFSIYILTFQLVFLILFGTPTPPIEILLLNFIVVAIVLLLIPAFREIFDLTKSLITTQKIDLPYVVDKLSLINPRKMNYKELSGFLAEHTHFSYVGIFIKDRLYVAGDCEIPARLLVKISKLPTPSHSVWQDITKLNVRLLREADISRVAAITSADGEVVGNIIFGHPISKTTLTHKDLVEIAMVVNLIGTIIDDGSRNA